MSAQVPNTNGDVIKVPDEIVPIPEVKASAEPKKEPEANKLFRMFMKLQASDLHLKVGQPPMMRLKGDIRRTEMRPLTQEDMERIMYPVLTAKQRSRLSLVSRRVNNDIPSFNKLGLPPIIEKLCKFPEGLVILAGVTGSGK